MGQPRRRPRRRRVRREKQLYVREFLNRPGFHSGAFIFAQCTDGGDGYTYPELTIADCAKQVTLALDMNNSDEQAENTLYKLTLLHDTIGKLRKLVKRGVDRRKRENLH